MMYASRDRRTAIRRWLPQNLGARGVLGVRTVGHNAGEGRVCCGGAPARRGGLGHERRRSRRDQGGDNHSVVGDHFGPQEPGELAGHGGGHHGADVLVDGQLSEAVGETHLGRPRAGDGGRGDIGLA